MLTSPPNRSIPVLSRIFLLIAVASIFLLSPGLDEQPALAQTQANCNSNCPQITNGVGSELKISGAITYSFDPSTLGLLGDDKTIKDFKDRFAAAAAYWQQQTGISITEAPQGSQVSLVT